MVKNILLIGFCLLVHHSVYAEGLLRVTDLKKYCGQESVHRQTVLYLDQSIIAKKDENWYKDIVNKIKFLPGERLQVIIIKTGGSTVEQAWDSCYPSYTKERYQTLKSNEGLGSLFTGGVDDNLSNDVNSFNKWFLNALAYPLAETRHDNTPSYKKGEFPSKNLIESFYYDSKRLDIENGISRVIVFSDMVENSSLLHHDNLDPIKLAEDVAVRFPMFLNHSSFYIYGISYTNNESILNIKLENFWKSYLLKSGAHIEHYGTQLVLPKSNEIFDAHSYSGFLIQSDGKKLASKMRLASSRNGELIYSWLTIGDYYMPLKGTINCSGANCEVTAKIQNSTFEGFKKNDIVQLSGTNKKYSGKIGARDDSVIDEEGKIYRFDVEYKRDKNLNL